MEDGRDEGRLLLVSGATGQQGGAVAWSLLGRDYFQSRGDQFEEQMGEEYTVMYRWFNDYGHEADVAALREEHPGLVSFEQYLRASGWENAGSPPEG